MNATQILMDEHLVIGPVLSALETAIQHLELGEGISPAFFINASLFIKNFADGCHHQKEESILFIALNAAGLPSQGGPVAFMLAEHVQGRKFTAAMNEATESWEKGDPQAKAITIQNARNYVNLLRQHIQKENLILFPMAERIMPAQQQDQVDIDFERAGESERATVVQENYRALAETLEHESGGKK